MTQPEFSTQAPTKDELFEIGLFGALDEPALEYLCSHLEGFSVQADEYVYREGEIGREMYVVRSGELEVTKRRPAGEPVRLLLLGSRDWFGEMSVLDMQPRSASVKAVRPTTLWRLRAGLLDGLYRTNMRAYSLFLLNLSRELSRRLRLADQRWLRAIKRAGSSGLASPIGCFRSPGEFRAS